MRKNFQVPTEDKKYVKDLRSNAFINIDEAGYTSFKHERARALRQQQLEKEVQSLQNDMKDIKQLLQQLVNGRTNGESNI